MAYVDKSLLKLAKNRFFKLEFGETEKVKYLDYKVDPTGSMKGGPKVNFRVKTQEGEIKEWGTSSSKLIGLMGKIPKGSVIEISCREADNGNRSYSIKLIKAAKMASQEDTEEEPADQEEDALEKEQEAEPEAEDEEGEDVDF